MNRQSQWLFEVPASNEAAPYNYLEYYSLPESEAEWETVGRLKVPRRSMPQRSQGAQVPRSGSSSCPPVSTQPRVMYGWTQHKRRVQDLPLDQQAKLRQVSNDIRMSYRPGCQPVRKVQIHGHADVDTPPNPRREKQMSDERAQMVRDWLKKDLGSKIAAQITWETQGFGATKLKVQPTTEANRRQNRRVEIALSTSLGERKPTVRISFTPKLSKNSRNRSSKFAPAIRSGVIIQPESILIPFGGNSEVVATGDPLPAGSPAYSWSIANRDIVQFAALDASQVHPNKATINGKCVGKTQISVIYKTKSGNTTKATIDVEVSPSIVGIDAAINELKSKINNCQLTEYGMAFWNLTCGIAVNRMVSELHSRNAFIGCRRRQHQVSEQLYRRIIHEGRDRCCVAQYRDDLATTISRLREALDDGFLIAASVLSGICTGQGGRCNDPTCCNIPTPKQRDPFPDHWILIIGHNGGNKFVFWDPHGSSSNALRAPCQGFGFLFYDSGKKRFSTAENDSEMDVDIGGDHKTRSRSGEVRAGVRCCRAPLSSPQHRYQVLTVVTT
jgi:OmpA family